MFFQSSIGSYHYSKHKDNGGNPISRPEMKIDSSFVVDMCTPSLIPIDDNLSIGNILPIPISFDDQNHNASVVDMDIFYTTVNSPVVIDGMDIYENHIVHAVQEKQNPNAPVDDLIHDI